MKFCINCGKKIQNGTKFCPYCGAKQNNSISGNNAQTATNVNTQPRRLNQNSQGSFMGTMNNYNQRMYNYAQTNNNPFVGALAKFFDNYANFSGRSTRSDFWFMFLWRIIIWACIDILFFVLIGFVIGAVVFIACIIPNISLKVRRLRDAGLSNVWITVLLVCYYFLGWTLIPVILLIVFAAMPSVQHPMSNQQYSQSTMDNYRQA